MKIKREFVTPFLVFIFLVVGTTGVFMFFHLSDDYTTVVHEFLGLTFVVFAGFHVAVNWRSIINYSKERKFIIPAVTVLIISAALIVVGKIHGNIENEILEKLIHAPVSNSFKTLDIDYHQAKLTLEKNGIVMTDSLESIVEIAVKNQKSPEDIMELIFE